MPVLTDLQKLKEMGWHPVERRNIGMFWCLYGPRGEGDKAILRDGGNAVCIEHAHEPARYHRIKILVKKLT